jgi:hypothetical protein
MKKLLIIAALVALTLVVLSPMLLSAHSACH